MSGVFQRDEIQRNSDVRYVETHVEIGSTNDRSLELCRNRDLPTPALVVAQRQTAGRGQRGNAWWSPDGALLFSLVVDENPSKQHATNRQGLIALAAAVGAADAIEKLIGSASQVAIKWPNDVLIDGKKAAGILVESPHVAELAAARLVIGVGLNVNNRSDDVGSLRECLVRELDLQAVLFAVLGTLLPCIETAWRDQDVVAARVARRCALTGRDVEVSTGGGVVRGECVGIATDGALMVRTSDGTRMIFSGTVTKY